MKKKSRMPSRKRVLHLIGGLMVASAVVRGVPVGQAVAESSVQAASEDSATMAVTENEPTTPDAGTLLSALQERETELEERERALEERLLAMQVAEAELMEQLTALTEAEEALRGTIALADSAAENDLERLTRVYENMKPKDAAALFEEMSPQFAAGFLGMMEPVSAAGIMTLLEPETAYSVSAVLAGRNAGVPTE